MCSMRVSAPFPLSAPRALACFVRSVHSCIISYSRMALHTAGSLRSFKERANSQCCFPLLFSCRACRVENEMS